MLDDFQANSNHKLRFFLSSSKGGCMHVGRERVAAIVFETARQKYP
ncbi:MAG: hypothetical protein OFPII_17210 [Osedax symbiont Rs1]|nr:MAG: hypothetical protein OFPII_17210 [Osedax symbiont Rs1]